MYKTPAQLQADQTEYAAKLRAMTDAELSQECETKIWLSAYAYNNPRSAYHWQCDATSDECSRRDRKMIYADAYKKVSKQAVR